MRALGLFDMQVGRSLPVRKEFLPKGIFLVKDLFLLFCQPVRVIRKDIEMCLPIKRENELTIDFIGIIHPPNHIAGVVLKKFIGFSHSPSSTPDTFS